MSVFDYKQYIETINYIVAAPKALKQELDSIVAQMESNKNTAASSFQRQEQQIQQQETALQHQYDSVREECLLLGFNILSERQRPVSCPFTLSDASQRQNKLALQVMQDIQAIRKEEIEKKNQEKAEEKKRQEEAEKERLRLEEQKRLAQLEQERLKREEEEKRRKKEQTAKRIKAIIPYAVALIVILILLILTRK